MKLFNLILATALLGFIFQQAAAGPTKAGIGDSSYAINLASATGHFTADTLPKVGVLQSHRVYTTSFAKDGRTWNRLRLGFFDSRSEANATLDELRAHYPDAWIAQVSADERLAASGTVLDVDRQRSVAETGTGKSSARTSSHAGQAEEGAGDVSYAINLASSLGYFTADALPKLDVLQAHRVYTASFVKGGRTWHRLRLGFFRSRSEANATLDELRAHYPDAWIAEVSAAEKRDSAATVLDIGKPHGVVDAPNDERQDYSGTEPGASKPQAAAEAATVTPSARTSLPVERLALAGAEYGEDNAYYNYVGLLVPFPGSDLGNGFVQRYWLDWLHYEYEAGDRTIRATAPGASVAVGYGRASTAGAWSFYLGPVWRDTDLSPDDPGSDVRGTRWGMNVSLQGDRSIDEDWRVNGIASFTTGTASYWTRGRLTRKLPSGPAAGVEIVLHGNDEYSAWQAGAVMLDIRLTPQTLLGLKGGARKTKGQDVGAYVGIELARSF